MNREMIEKFLGKQCMISSGSLGAYESGTVIDVKENWLEVETKKGTVFINADFVQSIKIVPAKE